MQKNLEEGGREGVWKRRMSHCFRIKVDPCPFFFFCFTSPRTPPIANATKVSSTRRGNRVGNKLTSNTGPNVTLEKKKRIVL